MILRLLLLALMAIGFSGCKNNSVQPATSKANDIGIAEFQTPDGWFSASSNGDTAVALARDTENLGRDEVINIDIIDPPFPNPEETG